MPTNEEIKEAQRMVYIVQSSEYLSEVDKALLVFAAAYRELLSRAESAEEQLRLANVDALTETARANDAETRAAETKTQAAKIWDRRVEPASSADPEAIRKALQNIADQGIRDEMDEDTVEDADWEAGYEALIKIARTALEKE